MRLKAIILEGFRSYKDKTRIDFDDLTALVGRNDTGKSTVLEALEIFLNNDQIKLEKEDACVFGEDKVARIGCIFTDFPEEITKGIVIDTRSTTTLEQEYLLNEQGELEVHKICDCSKSRLSPEVVAVANHPTGEYLDDLLLKKNDDLKDIAAKISADIQTIDKRSNVALRQAIRDKLQPLTLQPQEISIDSSDDVKKIWAQLEKHLPMYAFFRADRPSQDADSEVQDPLKYAVLQALKDVEDEINTIERHVKERAFDVAERTLAKLKDMTPGLAEELKTDFKAEPKWDKQFSFSLTADDGISLNKRGSGVRRLVLLNFFRAEAERRLEDKGSSNIIYAIEEPETSQNPLNQHMLMEALINLSQQEGIQVLVTTHTPGIAGLVEPASLRHIQQAQDKTATVSFGDGGTLLNISRELGVTADRRLKALIFVEGPSDIAYLKTFSKLLRQQHGHLPDLDGNEYLSLIPISGSNLISWVEQNYLSRVGLPEFHIYDRGNETPPKFQKQVDEVNSRGNGSWGTLLHRNEIENYLHPTAIEAEYGFRIEINPDTDVPIEIVQRQLNERGEEFDNLDDTKKKEKEKKVKRRLVNNVLPRMTLEQLDECDPDGEILALIDKIGAGVQD